VSKGEGDVLNKEDAKDAKRSGIQRDLQEGALIIPQCPVCKVGTVVRILDLKAGSVRCQVCGCEYGPEVIAAEPQPMLQLSLGCLQIEIEIAMLGPEMGSGI
jgi:uncharacterized Zn finger protein (UPF0148 family)